MGASFCSPKNENQGSSDSSASLASTGSWSRSSYMEDYMNRLMLSGESFYSDPTVRRNPVTWMHEQNSATSIQQTFREQNIIDQADEPGSVCLTAQRPPRPRTMGIHEQNRTTATTRIERNPREWFGPLDRENELDIVRHRGRRTVRDPMFFAPFQGPRFAGVFSSEADLFDSDHNLSLSNLFSSTLFFPDEEVRYEERLDAKTREETRKKLYDCWNEEAIEINLADKLECAICFEPIDKVNGSYKRLGCGHSDRFHFECIEKHFEIGMRHKKWGKCPLCRSYLRSDSDVLQEKIDISLEDGISF